MPAWRQTTPAFSRAGPDSPAGWKRERARPGSCWTCWPTRSPPASASPFILGPDYGTWASSVVLRQRQGGSLFVERRYQADGQAEGETWADWPAEARVPRLREVR